MACGDNTSMNLSSRCFCDLVKSKASEKRSRETGSLLVDDTSFFKAKASQAPPSACGWPGQGTVPGSETGSWHTL